MIAALWLVLGFVSLQAVVWAYFPHWPVHTWLRLRRRFSATECQYCDGMVQGWRHGIGAVNCDDCVHRMQWGQRPRCRKTQCTREDKFHGHLPY